MSQLSKLLSDELKVAEDGLAEARKAAKAANDRVDLLERRVDRYKGALAEATGKEPPEPEAASEKAVGGQSAGEPVNKSQLVRDVILLRAEQGGTTTKDLKEAFSQAGITYHPNYLYSMLMRLKRNRVIREVRGKYYPMEPKKVGE